MEEVRRIVGAGKGAEVRAPLGTYLPAGDEVELPCAAELLQRRDDVVAALLEVDAPRPGQGGGDGSGHHLAVFAMAALNNFFLNELPPIHLEFLTNRLEEFGTLGVEEVVKALDGGHIPGLPHDMISVGLSSRKLSVGSVEALHPTRLPFGAPRPPSHRRETRPFVVVLPILVLPVH